VYDCRDLSSEKNLQRLIIAVSSARGLTRWRGLTTVGGQTRQGGLTTVGGLTTAGGQTRSIDYTDLIKAFPFNVRHISFFRRIPNREQEKWPFVFRALQNFA
jgi:hypothetical protein